MKNPMTKNCKNCQELEKRIEKLENNKPHTHDWESVAAEGGALAFLTGKLNIYQECRVCGEVKII